MTADPLVLLPEVDRATDRLLATVSSLTSEDLALPALLPGWTGGHVLTHLARNADGAVNLLTWARTGVPTPQYESVAVRDADIEAGADRPLDEQLADLRASAERFTEAVAAMPAPAWAEVVQWATGTRAPAARVIWSRLREVEVHHVDLAGAYRPEDWPEAFVHRLLHELSVNMAGSLSLVLRATDIDHSVLVGTAPDAPAVSGPGYALAAWLTGRRRGEGLTISPEQPLPTPPQWI